MFESLFGIAIPLPVKFVLVFVFVLGLIGAFMWGLRRLGAGRLDGTRGRQHRLSVLEWARVDNRRALCLIRRDNVEHLLMIGGPSDVVVETNIVRALAASRDAPVARPPAMEPLPRAIPLPENGNGNSSWPLQPESMTPPPPSRPAPRLEPAADDTPSWPLQPQSETPAPRPQRDTLAALADELSARPAPQPPRSRSLIPPRTPPLEPRVEPRAAEPRSEQRSEPRSEPRPEPRLEPRIAAQPAPSAAEAAAADQSLAEMAHRLEAALRKPGAPAEARTPSPRPAPPAEQAAEPAAPPPPPAPRAARQASAEPKPSRNAPPKSGQGSTLYDNLEQEMASLLGRPTNKN
jgi:flagellar protein FliO/FliZ